MNEVRDKLIETLGRYISKPPCDTCKSPIGHCDRCGLDRLADYLIANGVTVQKWIPVTERLPEEHEYTAETPRGERYYVRLLIAYMTDTVEYEIGYYDGWKWMTEMPTKIIKNVVAWKSFEALPEPPTEATP